MLEAIEDAAKRLKEWERDHPLYLILVDPHVIAEFDKHHNNTGSLDKLAPTVYLPNIPKDCIAVPIRLPKDFFQ